MEGALGERRGEVLFEEHLDGVGKRLEQPEEAKAEDRGPVGPDAVLHDRALLAFDPGQKKGQEERPDEGQNDLDEDDEDIGHGFIPT